jgi:hypothetical protein
VHEALGALEQVGRFCILSGVEGVAASVGGRTGAGFLLPTPEFAPPPAPR